MVNCSVLGCNSRSGPKLGLTFHRYPKCEILKQKWITATGLPKKKLPMIHAQRVCSKHFTKDCFTKCKNFIFLVKNSVPTLNLRTEQHIPQDDLVGKEITNGPQSNIANCHLKASTNKLELENAINNSPEIAINNPKPDLNTNCSHILDHIDYTNEKPKFVARKPNRTVFKVIAGSKLQMLHKKRNALKAEMNSEQNKMLENSQADYNKEMLVAMNDTPATIQEEEIPPATRKYICHLQKKAAVVDSQKKAVHKWRNQVYRLQKKNEKLLDIIETMKEELYTQHSK